MQGLGVVLKTEVSLGYNKVYILVILVDLGYTQ